MMTDKQCYLYWRLWRNVCEARGWARNDDGVRHQVHRKLFGFDISHRHLTNEDFDYFVYSCRVWIDATDLEAILFLNNPVANGERRRLLWKIKQLAPEAYRRAVTVDLFDCNDLEKLDNEQLTLLRNTLKNRTQRRAVSQRGGRPMGTRRTLAKSPSSRQELFLLP